MIRADFHWHRFRFILVILLIFSVLGSTNLGVLPAIADFCFVEDSGSVSKSTLQFFALGEELIEKDVDDDSEGKHLFGPAGTSVLAFAITASSQRSFELTYSDRHDHVLNGRPIYLSYHSLLL